MADVQPANAAPNGPQANQQPAAGGGGVVTLIQSIGRMFFIYWVVKWATGMFAGSKQPQPVLDRNVTNVGNNPIAANAYLPLWDFGRRSDLLVYLSEKEYDPELTSKNLIWEEKGLVYGEWEEKHKEMQIDVPTTVQHNGTLYAHIFLTESGRPVKAGADRFSSNDTLYYRKALTRFMPKRKLKKTKSLVRKTEEELKKEVEEEVPEKDVPIISYWWPNVTIALVTSKDAIPSATPPAIMKNVRIAPDYLHYYPLFYVNDFWLLQDQLMPINETVKSLNISLALVPTAWWKYQMYTQFDESFKLQHSMMGVASTETDEMKRMFMETNPILLGITMVVSMLHSFFDFLAFKNDIQFWQKRKNMEGLSFRTIVINVFFQAVILLYLADNDTSWMVLISSGVGLVIEIWKIQKTVIVKQKETFPFVEFVDRVKPSKLVSRTKKYDEIAFRYVSYLLYPCLAGYAIYSLVYEQHKSWYSYVLSTLVGFVYAFGFVTMTPQLFINYKLKSVAHMPWKTFMYKALNTFVDDLFAFVIKMPLLHRIACLRDDVIFFVYLYQRWIYPEDKRRRNEFVSAFVRHIRR
ncbi:cleft lip and palate transmembrane protein 1-domain-containing protein [Phlyctochytrium arcticum]|nr:cleft lip and palate transmembrane protein 1-domain-containing protein [Phlyctochytrium arcticum]